MESGRVDLRSLFFNGGDVLGWPQGHRWGLRQVRRLDRGWFGPWTKTLQEDLHAKLPPHLSILLGVLNEERVSRYARRGADRDGNAGV